MKRWGSQGFVLAVRAFGETDAIVTVLTPDQGRHAGLVKGGQSRKLAPALQLGNQLELNWAARLADNLGRFDIDLTEARCAGFLQDRKRLQALRALCAVLQTVLPEREILPHVYDAALSWFSSLETDHWAETLTGFELGLLSSLGFGLDLSACAATGITDDLIYVSPRSGRAVSAEAGEPYKEKLLMLPAYLRGQTPKEGNAKAGLMMTGHFIEKNLCYPLNRPLPEDRELLPSIL